jgi:hypothetical protein
MHGPLFLHYQVRLASLRPAPFDAETDSPGPTDARPGSLPLHDRAKPPQKRPARWWPEGVMLAKPVE